MRFLVDFKRIHPWIHREVQAGAGERVPGIPFHAQAAWILLLTPLKPGFWSTFVWNSQTVSRFSSFPMLMRIAAQAAAIRAALLQNAKQSNDFYRFLNPEIPNCNIKMPMSQSMHPVQGFCSDGSDSFTLCNDCAPLRIWIHMQIQIQMQIQIHIQMQIQIQILETRY